MVSCTHCSVQNSLDSKFCKSCGLGLPEDELNAAIVKNEELIADGYRLFEAGRTEEAQMVAQTALEASASSVTALSLLGMCHEREGRVAEALAAFEQVLALKPDSALDKIKVNQLRGHLANKLQAENAPNRRLALAGAALAVVLVGSIGAIIASATTRPAIAQNTPSPEVQQQAMTFPPGGGITDSTEAGVPQQDRPPVQIPEGAEPPLNEAPPIVAPSGPVAQGRGLPPAREITGSVPPVTLTGVIGNLGLQPSGQPANPQQGGSLPSVGQPQPPVYTGGPDPSPESPKIETREEPKENHGIIEIKVSPRHQRPASGSQESDGGGNELQALMSAARQQFQLKRYDEAARTYERALRAGGDAASINQRLGQCYSYLGRNAEAIAAYNRAIVAYESLMNSGRADARVAAALESCRQALKVLGG
jgi:tetratricopeptide (TPR) repeat protein